MNNPKIALLICGDIRDINVTRDCIDTMFWDLKNYEYESFLFGYKEDINKFQHHFDKIDNLICLKKPNREVLESTIITGRTRQNGVDNHGYAGHLFEMLHRVRLASDFVMSLHKDFDYFFYCRPNIHLKINIEKWLSEDHYCEIEGGNPVWLANDCGIAKPEIMKKAWDYRDLDTLNKLMNDSETAEDVCYKICRMNGVAIARCPYIEYDRHGQELRMGKDSDRIK